MSSCRCLRGEESSVLGPEDPRDVIYMKTKHRKPSTDQSSRRLPHRKKQPTASSATIQAQVTSSLWAPVLLEPYEGA
ncbi:hypothetical protein TNCV_3403421 [Trichonephila clavipes]|nr:hypothetical protein TNCV_3403421 [Trichonephila clavipes]